MPNPKLFKSRLSSYLYTAIFWCRGIISVCLSFFQSVWRQAWVSTTLRMPQKQTCCMDVLFSVWSRMDGSLLRPRDSTMRADLKQVLGKIKLFGRGWRECPICSHLLTLFFSMLSLLKNFLCKVHESFSPCNYWQRQQRNTFLFQWLFVII